MYNKLIIRGVYIYIYIIQILHALSISANLPAFAPLTTMSPDKNNNQCISMYQKLGETYFHIKGQLRVWDLHVSLLRDLKDQPMHGNSIKQDPATPGIRVLATTAPLHALELRGAFVADRRVVLKIGELGS
jgi:hypothetical protein